MNLQQNRRVLNSEFKHTPGVFRLIKLLGSVSQISELIRLYENILFEIKCVQNQTKSSMKRVVPHPARVPVRGRDNQTVLVSGLSVQRLAQK